MGSMKKAKSIKKFLVLLVILIILAVLGFSAKNFLSAQFSADNYITQTETIEIKKRDLLNSINVSGKVTGSDVIKITSTLNSRVKTLNVQLGDYVNEGDVLCIFDSSDFQREYDSLVASTNNSGEQSQHTHEVNQRALENAQQDKIVSLEQAQRNIDKALRDQENAYNKYNSTVEKYNDYAAKKDSAYQEMITAQNDGDEEKYQRLNQQYQEYAQQVQTLDSELNSLGSQLTTYDDAVQSAYDAYTNAERTADNAIRSAQDAIDSERFTDTSSTQLQLDNLQEKINKCTVTAPQSGIITALNISEGSIPNTDSIISIENDSSLKITVSIKESDILNVTEGMKAIIKTSATGEKSYSGSVLRVEKVISTGNSSSDEGYSTEIMIDNKDSDLYIGMNAKVQIILEEKSDVLAVPYDSILQNDEDDFYIMIAETNDGVNYSARSVVIEKGLETDYYVEIISSEISEGDILIASPASLQNGDVIFISDMNGN